MVYRPKVDNKLCFVLTPLREPFNSYYYKIIKPAAEEAGLAALRSDEIYSTKSIINDIWARIWAAKVVIADATEKNPNVNYELGLCDALGVPVIRISASIEDIPFDYRHKRCITYDRSQPSWDDKLRSDLHKTIAEVLSESDTDGELTWPYDTTAIKEPPSGLLISTADSKAMVVRGARLARDAVATAIGARGLSVALSQAFGVTRQSQQGLQIVRGIKSPNILEEKGIEQLRVAASSTYDVAGDCTKLVCILCAGLMTGGQALIDRGFHTKDVTAALDRTVARAQTHLTNMSRPLSGEQLLNVAVTAARGDAQLGCLVVNALSRAGQHGVVTVETSQGGQNRLDVQEGLRFDNGYLSDRFVTDPEKLECVLEDCLILFHQAPIVSMKDLLPLLEQVARSDKSLLVIADRVEGEALSTLAVNKLRGTLRCAAVKAPGFADRRKALMEDAAVITGAVFFSEELGIPLANVRIDNLGRAKKVVVTEHATTIIGGGGSTEKIQNRIGTIRTQISTSPSGADREKLQERLAILAGGLVAIKVGGLSENDALINLYKTTSAMHSARSAVEHGTVNGGGAALSHAAALIETEGNGDELDRAAASLVAAALREPIQLLIQTAGKSPTQVLAEIAKTGSPKYGFNVQTGCVVDLEAAGILDPAKPILEALGLAFSHARFVLETAAWDMSGSEPGK